MVARSSTRIATVIDGGRRVHSDASACASPERAARRVRARLRAVAEAPPERQPDVLFTRMRALFYPDEERCYVAKAMEVTLEDDTRVTMAVLAPNCAYVFPPVEYLTILDSKPFQIPFAALESVVSDRAITWLDDACRRSRRSTRRSGTRSSHALVPTPSTSGSSQRKTSTTT